MAAQFPLLSVAPMEGLTGVIFRQVHSRLFGGADVYYIPFVTPTTLPKFTDRQLRELAPEVNAGLRVVPQLLTRRTEDFVWAAKALKEMGYDEVNLNVGCPAGTVVAKGKGAGFLRNPVDLDHFLDAVFEADLGIDVSVKTRLGWSEESEFDLLSDVFDRHPIKTLIIHPRLKSDQYKGRVRTHVFEQYYGRLHVPVGYNGDLTSVEDILLTNERFGRLQQIMVGRAIMADPALFRKVKAGAPATRDEVVEFTASLFDAYARAFNSRKNALMRIKEYWFYQINLFEGAQAYSKELFKAKTPEAFNEALRPIVEDLPIRSQARFGWFKPI